MGNVVFDLNILSNVEEDTIRGSRAYACSDCL